MDVFTVPSRVYNEIDFKCSKHLSFSNWFSTFNSYDDDHDYDDIDEDDPNIVLKDDSQFKKPAHLSSYRLKDEPKREKKDSKTGKEVSVPSGSFANWCARIFQPSYMFYGGESNFNPVLFFHITTLADGYVGGVMSNIVMT